MAQEKLLLILIYLFLFSFNVKAEERFEFKKEDMDLARELMTKSSQISMSVIAEKWLELQKMQQNEAGKDDPAVLNELLPSGIGYPEHELKIFVSNSMGRELLKNYVKQARYYKAILVFNGLPSGSWRKLSELVYEITGDDEEGAAMQIDDLAFTEYGITSVPSFVLSKEQGVFEDSLGGQDRVVFDKVTGNIGIRRALEEIVEKGELSMSAAKILEGAKSQ